MPITKEINNWPESLFPSNDAHHYRENYTNLRDHGSSHKHRLLAEHELVFHDLDAIRTQGNFEQKHQRLQELLAFTAIVLTTQTLRDNALVEVGRLYTSMGWYERGNTFLQYVIDANQDVNNPSQQEMKKRADAFLTGSPTRILRSLQ